MTTGLNQEFEILGRTIHFQSEVTDQAGPNLRIEIFSGGKVVATRDIPIDGVDTGDRKQLRARVMELHNQAVRSFKERVTEFRQRRAEEQHRPAPLEPDTDEGPVPEADTGISVPRVAGAVAGSLQTRRLFGGFRERVEPVMPVPPELDDRLVEASSALHEMIATPGFSDLRFDEQMHCHLILDKVENWMKDVRGPEEAVQIWRDLVLFNGYLSEINHRADLLEFDRDLVLWSIDALRNRGESGVFEQLRHLYGRHPQIDRMLGDPGGVTTGMWVAHLRSVLKQIRSLEPAGNPVPSRMSGRGESDHDTRKECNVMSQIDDLCKELVEDAPDAVAANVVDLSTGMMLGGHFLSNFTSDHFEAVSAAATALYRGRETLRVEDLVKSQRGDTSDAHFMEEVQFSTVHLHHFISLIPGREAILCLVTKKPGNLGMGWSALRSRLNKMAPLVPS